MSVRPGTVDDLPAVLALERSAPEAPHWTAAQYLALLEGGDGGAARRRAFVWESGGAVLGFAAAMALHAGGMCGGELENLVVAASARRRGIASALCGEVVAWCRVEGASEVALEVRASNHAALALYRALGFSRVGERKDYYRNPAEGAVTMRLEVS